MSLNIDSYLLSANIDTRATAPEHTAKNQFFVIIKNIVANTKPILKYIFIV